MNSPKRIAAISGSLKKSSVNTAILNKLASIAENETEFHIYEGLDKLPFFSPELDTEQVAASVTAWRAFLKSADGIIVCTPEYAFGVPGVLKNALDWTVGSGEFYQKPVITISASTSPLGGDKAHDSLRLTMTAMGAILFDEGKLIIPSVRAKIDSTGNVIDSDLEKKLNDLLELLISNLK